MYLLSRLNLRMVVSPKITRNFFPSVNQNVYRFDLKTTDIFQRAQEYMKDAKQVYDTIANLSPSDVTISSIINPLHKLSYEAYVRTTQLEFLQHVCADPEIRDASCEADKQISEFEVEQSMRVDVFKKIKALHDMQTASTQTSADHETRRFLDKLVRDGKRSGLDLPEDLRLKVEEKKKELSKLCINFNFNISQENTILYFTKDQLTGVQQDLIDSLETHPTDPTLLKITLKSPHFVPIMKNCTVRSTRQTIERAYNSRCIAENLPILEQILSIRSELASILGYPSHSDLITETRMSKTSHTVQSFIKDLKLKVDESGRAVRELEMMKKLRQTETGESIEVPMAAYDVSYYRNMMMEKNYSVDNVEIQKYFPFDHVTNEMLKIYETILSIKFSKDDSQPVWHPDVVCYKVLDNSSGVVDDVEDAAAATRQRLIGYFYMDMFPRDGKYSHAALFPLQPNCEYEGERSVGVCSLVCNFTKPTANKPACLTHDEVTTYFHEFGHCMHHLCAEKVKYPIFSGTNVERDFVECPSQMLENWCWEKEILKKLGKHFETNQPFSDEMINSLINSRNADEGMATLKQLTYASFDQLIHSRQFSAPILGESVADVYARVHEEITGLAVTEGTAMPASFGHLCGYDAQYYGYLWAEVFSADCFVTKFQKDLLNPEVGRSYRYEILAFGGSKDATELLQKFLGRDPQMDAFLVLKGMK